MQNLEFVPPLTWAGFDAWLALNEGFLNGTTEYKANRNGSYDGYSNIIRTIGNIIFAQKFEGAAVGLYNANIISRDLGLAEKKEIEMPKLGKDAFADVYA